MPTEDRLSGALERAAGPLPESVGDWDALRSAGSARWRRRRSEAGVAIATVVALTLGIVFAADDTEDGHSVVTTPPVNQEILARIVDSGVQKLVVASAADGSVVREIAADGALANWGSVVSVPDAGGVAYVTIGEPDPNTGSCGSDIQTSPIVARVDLSTGSLTPLLRASNAAIVSPDGRRVAYVAGLGGCTVLPEDRDQTLGFLGVASGEVTRPYDDRDPRVLAPIAWSRDGARLLTMGPSGDNRTTSFLELDEFPFDASPRSIALAELFRDDLFRDATYLPDGRLVVAYVRGFEPNRPSQAVSKVAIVNKQGAIIDPLFETKANFTVESIDVGRDGRIVLTSRFGGLAVWTPGDDAPVILIEGGGPLEVRGATWLPSSSSVTVTTTTTTQPPPTPTSIVSATTDRRLVVLDVNGNEVRPIAQSGQDVSWVARSPDGTTAYYARGTLDPCDDTGEIDVVNLDADPPQVQYLLSGAMPALSPDGSKLAYRSGLCGGDLHVRDLESGDERVWPLGSASDQQLHPELVGAVGWDADNEHVILEVERAGATQFWYFHTGSDTDVITGLPLPQRGVAGQSTAVDFEQLGRPNFWAYVYDPGLGNPWTLNSYLAPGGNSTGQLVQLPPGDVAIAASTADGRHFLLLVDGALYRWSIGDEALTFVAEGVTAADW